MKITKQSLPLIAVVCFAACATTPTKTPAPLPTPQSSFAAETSELRRALEETVSEIESRHLAAIELPVADIQAAVSMPIPDHPSVYSALRLFTGRMRNDIQTFLLRSARYKNLIDKVLDDHRLPRGLLYLPVIESGYTPTLTSRAGAHGIWQFMPDTAREYGMRVDWWIDERAEAERSTRAAAEFLVDLYREFEDWPLALAAYNAGPGRIRRALEKTGATTFWELLEQAAIPKETRGYVPTFFATLIIATDPDTYGFRLDQPSDSNVRRVDVHGPVSLRYLAEVGQIEESRLREMNPALRRGVVPPGRWPVLLPAENAAAVADRGSSLRGEDASIEISSYTLRRGDTIKRLARAIGSTPETILEMNGADSAAELRAGEAIYLPVRARELGSMLSGSDDSRLYYAVRKGDTLYSIAKKHNLTVEELRDLNELARGQSLKAGQRLRVSAPRPVTAGGM
jgi:membrane-bound lytic murein transglycosylase D